MDKLIIAFNGNQESEIEKVSGTIISVNWDSLLPTISSAVRLRDDEIIDGLVINDVELRVKISRKKGRKIKAA